MGFKWNDNATITYNSIVQWQYFRVFDYNTENKKTKQ